MNKLTGYREWSACREGACPSWSEEPPQRSDVFDASQLTIVDWMQVPGIGKTLANRLVENAPYASIEDVLNVKGVSKGIFERINETLMPLRPEAEQVGDSDYEADVVAE